MPDVIYRTARPEDVPEMADLFLTSVADMLARSGTPPLLPPRPAVLAGYEHIRSTGTFHLAETDGRIAAIAGAVVRGRLWFLSAFWAHPDLQGQGIGGPLLQRVRDDGVKAGADVFFVWSSSDSTAMAAYLKMGMLPGYQILVFDGAPRELPSPPSGLDVRPLGEATAADLDEVVRGCRREVDHRLWLSAPGSDGREVLRGGEPVGYYYCREGSIGPAAWGDPALGASVLALACREAVAAGEPIHLAVPGINHQATRFALGAGLRLTCSFHLLTSAPFGHLDQYVASGPGLF